VTESDEILVRHDENNTVWICINRAHKHNALAGSILQGLASAVGAAADSPDTKVVVIRGSGDRYFAAGGDLRELSAVRDVSATHAMADNARKALDTIRNCPVPVLAYINGDAIGGGAELAVACDMRLQASHARIGFIQAKLAISSAWGGGADLFALVGAGRAMAMMARCELIDSMRALEWGLADAEITDGEDGNDVKNFIEPFLRCSRPVLQAIKAQSIAWRSGQALSDRREVEREQLLKTWLHADHWAASDRFLMR
jgi:enoyl-CoA hydratase